MLPLSWVADAAGTVAPQHWPDCKTVGCVVSQRIVGTKVCELEERRYISSRVLSAPALAQAVRAHWGIENRLHWMLDVCFGEDGCMVRKDNAPQNLSLLKKIVLNLIRMDSTDKASVRQKQKRAAWGGNILMAMTVVKSL